MKRDVRRIVAVVLSSASVAWTLPLASQGAARPPEQTSQAAEMTVLGCLRGATNPTMEMKGTIYTLELIEKSTPPPGATGSTAGAREQEAAPKTASRYTLVASESVGLAKHVNHRVELTGRLKAAPAPSSASTPERAQGQGKPPQPPPPGGAHNTFEVSALKMVSPSCP